MFQEAHRDEHIDGGMTLLQANLDDMNPELTTYVSDLLFAHGANDVYWVPIIMKRGRPGVMLNVLTDRSTVESMEEIIFRETTTLGIRRLDAAVHRLGRNIVPVETPWGTINVKVGLYRGAEVQYAPEYRDCAAAAERHGVPLKAVYDEVRRCYAEQKAREQAK
ncbi:nickel insertion protein [Paenibacillus thermotolerans]|uniref:nickel insertion protein n=1 Tax=Paenibacillus thermotolerans TaxID=3027807 RepID=UPI0030824559